MPLRTTAIPTSLCALRVLLIACSLFFAACEAPPAPRSEPGPPKLQLISSAPLSLPETCEAPGSAAVEFSVLPDGRTTDIRPAAASPCLSEALRAWVAAFRYQPVTGLTQSRIEWLLVTGAR